MVPATSAYLPFSERLRVLPMGSDTLFREIGIAYRSIRNRPEVTGRLMALVNSYAVNDFEAALPCLEGYGYSSLKSG